MAKNTCSVDGCEKFCFGKGLCNAHYSQVRRYGTVEKIRVRQTGSCELDGCDRPKEKGRICGTHYQRMRKTGSYEILHLVDGSLNPSWRGDDVGYVGLHLRLMRTLGSAAQFSCVDCGKKAGHWSYDHLDPAERPAKDLYGPYSLDEKHYAPRCHSCHKKFDIAEAKMIEGLNA